MRTIVLVQDEIPQSIQNLRNFVANKPVILREAGIAAETMTKELCPVDTGRLRGSYSFEVIEDDVLIFGTGVEYGPYVEFGTHSMKPQPHFRPGIQVGRARLIQVAEQLAKVNT